MASHDLFIKEEKAITAVTLMRYKISHLTATNTYRP